ncbi:MAG: VOC family protein, partial [Chloroflexota bacterium]|nr:VOC family protein [Chloroflexota bacterium]
MERIPVDRLYHATVVVSDLKAMARSYAEILGIERWKVAHCTAERLTASSAFGFAASYGYSTATGSNACGVTFRLVQPTDGFSTFTEFLITRGQGIHGMCVAVLNEGEFRELKGWLESQGIAVGQAATVDGAARHYFFDTRKALGGFYVELVVPQKEGWEEAITIDEEWDFSAEMRRPAGVEVAQEVPRVGHFGVAVRNLMDRLPAYARLLGMTGWRSLYFHHEPGSLEYSTLNGQEVQHAFLLATSAVADF